MYNFIGLNFKTICYLIVPLSLITSCNNDNETILPQEQEIPYLLKSKITVNNDSTNGIFQYFNYNLDQKIQNIQTVVWGYYDDGRIDWKDTTLISFEYINDGDVRTSFLNEGQTSFSEYEYSNGRIIKATHFFPENVVISQSLYEYDDQGYLEKSLNLINNNEFSESYIENDGENILSITSVLLSNDQKYKTDFTAYDDKINLYKTINGMPNFLDPPYAHTSFGAYSSNNLLSSQSSASGNLQLAEYKYEYNDFGLPIHMTYSNQNVSYEYYPKL